MMKSFVTSYTISKPVSHDFVYFVSIVTDYCTISKLQYIFQLSILDKVPINYEKDPARLFSLTNKMNMLKIIYF